MKKIIALLMILTLALSLMVGCGDKEKDYNLAIGVATSVDGTEVSNTVAAIVTDADGKIVLCRIDTISVAPTVKDGAVDETATFKSKAEKGDSYNMVTYGGAKSEWYVQAKAVEEFVVGKTRNEVKAIAVDDSGKPTGADLSASCTISVDDFKKAIDKAFESAHKVSFKSASKLTAGVAVAGDVSSENSEVSYAADFAATVFADGKIVAVETVSQNESQGFGAACAEPDFYTQYNGTTEENYKDVDGIAGATVTTSAYNSAIGKVFETIKIMEGAAQ